MQSDNVFIESIFHGIQALVVYHMQGWGVFIGFELDVTVTPCIVNDASLAIIDRLGEYVI